MPRRSSPPQAYDNLFGALFSRMFVYSILFEDSDVDWRHFILDPESRVLTIAGAGCGVAAMPASQPASMDVVDSNLAHLSLSALKTLGPRHLSYDDFHQLFGVGRTPRAEMFIASVLRDPHLPEPIQKYWSGRRRPFGRGLYRSGLSNRMTQGLASVCRIDADWICEVAELSADERAARVRHDVLKRLRLPGVRHVASSPLQLLSLGINFTQKARIERAERVSFFEHVQRYLEQMSQTDMMRNWFIWIPLAGQFNAADELAMPPYLRPACYERSQASNTEVRFHHNNIFKVMEAAPDGSWTHVNCSDIMDWMNAEVQDRFLNLVHAKATPGARVLIRSVEPTESTSHFALGGRLRRMDRVSDQATIEDRTCLYRSVDFYEVVK